MRWLVVAGILGLALALHASRPIEPGRSSDCEPVGTGVLRQPGNASSALVLAGSGVWIAHRRRAGAEHIFGVAVLAAGVGSFLAHATGHPIALAIDMVGAGAAAAAALAVLVATRPPPLRVLTAAVVAATGLAVWARSRTGGPWCDPDLIVGGHAIWHLLVAVAALLLVRAESPES
jgi:hypothetical protein